MLCPVARFLGELIESFGHAAEVHSSSTEALTRIVGGPSSIDLVICDQNMPGVSGMELAKTAHEIRRDLPVVLCTGSDTSLGVTANGDASLLAVLQKPFEETALQSIIEQIAAAKDPDRQ